MTLNNPDLALLLVVFVLTAIFVLYTLFWVAKMLIGLAKGGTKLQSIAEREILPGKKERLEYRYQGVGDQALWLSVETHWEGKLGWELEISLDIDGDVTRIQGKFPIGMDGDGVDIDSPLLKPGLTALNSSGWSTSRRGKMKVLKKLCDIVALKPQGEVHIAFQAEPSPSIRRLKLKLIAA